MLLKIVVFKKKEEKKVMLLNKLFSLTLKYGI